MSVVNRLPGIEPHLPMLMGLVFGRLRERLAAEAPDLRPSQLRVLEWLPPEGMTITELAECVDMTTQGCGQFVRQLAELGMVEVAVAEHDARARSVRITDAGRDALTEGRIAGAAMDVGRAPDQMPSPELARLANVIATPHIGGLTPPASESQAFDTVRQVEALIKGEVPPGAANLEDWTRRG